MKRFAALAITAALTAAALAIAAGDVTPEAKAWWAHVEALASDEMEGRKPGTPGFDKAVAYVTSQFQSAGLEPGASGKWTQPVDFEIRQLDESKCSLELIDEDGKAEPLMLGHEAYLTPRGISGGTVEAPLVFVGHGLQVPEAGVDDLKGVDLKGKVAVFLSAAPKTLPPSLAAHVQSTEERWKALRAAGAIGVALFLNPKKADIPWERSSLARLQPALSLADAEMRMTTGLQVSIFINAAHADRLLGGSGHTAAELLALDDAGKTLPSFALKQKVRARTIVSEKLVASANIAGILHGQDPVLKKEAVVMSAHLDHLGVGRPINGDGIYNGAMDNASGIASIIEIAKELRGKKLKRSVIFLAVTGEEGGLLGSRYFTRRPTWQDGPIVANVNLDMFLPIVPLNGLAVQGLGESELGTEFAAVAKKFGVEAKADPEPERNAFIRSDQYSFIRSGIPALAFKFYAAPGTPEHKTVVEWRSKRYHAPSDDLQQPVDKEGAAKFTRILAAMAEDVANRPQRPRWNDNSFFKRFADQKP